MMIRQSIPVGSMSPATVKMEPNTIPSSNFPHPPSVSHGPYQGITSLQSSPPSSTSQDMITNNDNVQEFKPVVGGLSQPLRPIGPVAESASILNNISQIRQAMDSANPNTANFMGLQPMGTTLMAMHMPNVISSGMASTALPPPQNRQGQPVFITKLEVRFLRRKPTKHNPLYHISIMPNGYVVEMKMKSILTLGVGCRCPSVLYTDVKWEVVLAA
ncbi:hypothetical protein MKW98_025939 [Papaver atlanticum]|uniref:Uncharacterized protein n=1 Tax=Papaver atlanticum TaxID=357466 RepID=A0AAD4SI61_9MAGN|nr:hypothetical protein MKW98_025939 [Papaver atlanticum]